MKQVPALKIDGITIGQSVSAGLGRPLMGAGAQNERTSQHDKCLVEGGMWLPALGSEGRFEHMENQFCRMRIQKELVLLQRLLAS